MEEEKLNTTFSIARRGKSFTHAGRGLLLFVKTTHNAWIQLVLLALVSITGFYFHISSTEWMLLIIASGMVLTAEAFNTAIEIDIDLTSPEFHPYARNTKDVAAGAVLISAIAAACIGLIIFIPRLAIL